MKRLLVLVVLLLAAAATWVSVTTPPEPDPETPEPASVTHAAPATRQGFLYGRVTTTAGATHEGRLRFGGNEEAFWGDYFNGFKDENPWVTHAPHDQFTERRTIALFGVELASRERQVNVGRPFMARFGDISRIEAHGRDLRVTLKSGTVFRLDRYSADDFADGVRVWDAEGGFVDFHERQVRAIDLLPTPSLATGSYRLHGTVRTRQGDFTGFVQWDRQACVGTDELMGLPFDTIRSIERTSPDTVRVTLLDGREIPLTDTRRVGKGNRGMYVDDRRYGRVLIAWDAFERVDFDPGGSGPAYGDFPPGRPLSGKVTTRDGRLLAGRLVYDLDESETTETLDAPSGGVDYTIPFGLVASIVPPGRVTLRDGEELQLERAGDLGERNAGMLVFVDDRPRPEYVSWSDVAEVRFDRPSAMP